MIKDYIEELKLALDRLPLDKIRQIINTLIFARGKHASVFLMGNGGSSSTAEHFAVDLQKREVRATCLSSNMATMTAFANDGGYENVFMEQLKLLAKPGDVVIAFSASGESPNILLAVREIKHICITLGFTGAEKSTLGDLVETCVVTPADNIGEVEDLHLIIAHIISRMLL